MKMYTDEKMQFPEDDFFVQFGFFSLMAYQLF